MQRTSSALDERGVEVVAISSDPPADGARLRERLGLTFPVLSDPGLEAIDAYGVRHASGHPMEGGDIARPAAFLVDRDGHIVWRELTDDWRVRLRPQRVLEVVDALE